MTELTVLMAEQEQAHGVSGYAVLATVTAMGIAVFAVAMTVNWLLRPRVPTTGKRINYESGCDPVGSGWQQSNVRYYLYVFLYLIFAVDVVYLLPWATVLARLGWAGVVEMGVFVGVLAVGLLHAWRAGVLKWQ